MTNSLVDMVRKVSVGKSWVVRCSYSWNIYNYLLNLLETFNVVRNVYKISNTTRTRMVYATYQVTISGHSILEDFSTKAVSIVIRSLHKHQVKQVSLYVIYTT